MDKQRLYQLFQSETREPAARIFRGVRYTMVAAGIGIMLADTVGAWREAYRGTLDAGFQIVGVFFFAEYVLRLIAAPGAPGAAARGRWQSRFAWATSPTGVFDFLGALPGVLNVLFNPGYASLFGFIWAFKVVPDWGKSNLIQAAIANQRRTLRQIGAQVFVFAILFSSLIYLLERSVQPEVFGSIPAALWYTIVTISTVGYGDVIPQTVLGRLLAGVMMVYAIIAFGLVFGAIGLGLAEEIRRRNFIVLWTFVAKVPAFSYLPALRIAQVSALLEPWSLRRGASVTARGDSADAMYFILKGEVRISGSGGTSILSEGDYFGEEALVLNARRATTVIAQSDCDLFRLRTSELRNLVLRYADLAEAIRTVGNEVASQWRGDRRLSDVVS
jgi:voltage-gated potassium channel